MITLGVSYATSGMALVITSGQSIGLYTDTMLRRHRQQWHRPVRLPDHHLARPPGGRDLVTRYTGYGRMIYAVGGNPEAARLAGINVVVIRISAYAICAGLAAFAGFWLPGSWPRRRPTPTPASSSRPLPRCCSVERASSVASARCSAPSWASSSSACSRTADHLEHQHLLPERDHGGGARDLGADRPLPPSPRGASLTGAASCLSAIYHKYGDVLASGRGRSVCGILSSRGAMMPRDSPYGSN